MLKQIAIHVIILVLCTSGFLLGCSSSNDNSTSVVSEQTSNPFGLYTTYLSLESLDKVSYQLNDQELETIVKWVELKQLPNGIFKDNEYDPYNDLSTTYYAVYTLHKLGKEVKNTDKLLEQLNTLQLDSGLFVDSLKTMGEWDTNVEIRADIENASILETYRALYLYNLYGSQIPNKEVLISRLQFDWELSANDLSVSPSQLILIASCLDFVSDKAFNELNTWDVIEERIMSLIGNSVEPNGNELPIMAYASWFAVEQEIDSDLWRNDILVNKLLDQQHSDGGYSIDLVLEESDPLGNYLIAEVSSYFGTPIPDKEKFIEWILSRMTEKQGFSWPQSIQ